MIAGMALSLIGVSAVAQGIQSHERVNTGTVTVLTDGLWNENGRGNRTILALAREISQLGKLRVLPMAGEGGPANLRDLLYLKGIDVAVMNADVLRHQQIGGQYGLSDERVRLITKLFDQRAFLLGSSRVTDIRHLTGKKVGVPRLWGQSRITAETIFKLLDLDVELLEIGSLSGSSSDLNRFDALFFLEEDLVQSRALFDSLEAFSLIPIPATPDLAEIYERAAIERSVPVGRQRSEVISTLSTATVMAVFNWPQSSNRYNDVSVYIGEFLKSLLALRQSDKAELWKQVAITAAVPGWKRFAPASPERWLDRATLIRVASALPTQMWPAREISKSAMAASSEALPPQPAAKTGTSPTIAAANPPPRKVRVLALENPPFASQKMKNGGLLAQLLRSGLESTQGEAGELQFDWADSTNAEAAIEAIAKGNHDIIIPVEGRDCDQPSLLSRRSAYLCDRATFSLPLIPVVIGVFVPADSKFVRLDVANQGALRVCLAEGRSAGRLEQIKSRQVTILREDSLINCLSKVQQGVADAFVANELEGRYLIRQLGVAAAFRMLEEPVATRTMHAAVMADRPDARRLLSLIDSGLAAIKKSDVYGSVVREYVISLWRQNGQTQR